MKVFTAFLDLLAAYDSIPREKLWRHLAKNLDSTIFERYHPNHVHRMPLPSYWWWQNFRGGCAQQRLETELPSEPLSPLLFPLYQWHWQILDCAERCCHCLKFSSGPSLWLCWWHCSHFKHSWMSTVPANQIPQLPLVSRGSSSTLTKRKSRFSSAKILLRFPPSRTMAHL